MIIVMLGGIRIPRVPPTETEPTASRLLYPRLIISGTDTRPTVAAVAGLDPQMAANPVQVAMLLMASPPGSQLSQEWAALYMSSPTPEKETTSAIRMKRGSVIRKMFVPVSAATSAI
jgi:hypothetical protein